MSENLHQSPSLGQVPHHYSLLQKSALTFDYLYLFVEFVSAGIDILFFQSVVACECMDCKFVIALDILKEVLLSSNSYWGRSGIGSSIPEAKLSRQIIAKKAAKTLEPVTLEIGGPQFSKLT